LLQLEELADKVLFSQTQWLQLTQNLLKDLENSTQKRPQTLNGHMYTTVQRFGVHSFWSFFFLLNILFSLCTVIQQTIQDKEKDNRTGL